MAKRQVMQSGEMVLKKAKKIWDLDGGYQCSILGSCLGDNELTRINSRSDVVGGPFSSSFELHNRYVGICSCRCAASEAIHRLLMTKYKVVIIRYHRQTDEALLFQMWKESIESGEVAGAYWALCCHPTASNELVSKCYGDVHMLSHDGVRLGQRLGGKISQLTTSKKNVEAKLEEVSRRKELKEEKYLAQIQQLQDEIRELKDARLVETVQAQSRGSMIELAQFESQVAESKRLLQENEKLMLRVIQLEEENKEYKEERDKKDLWLAKNLTQTGCQDCSQVDTGECPGEDLCGKTVLYVGGMHKMIPHYKSTVEKNGGAFLHHDGGREESKSRLPKMLVQADAVMCPIDCVSHDACLTVKRMCKQYETPYVMMRSSGISSLIAGLGDLSL